MKIIKKYYIAIALLPFFASCGNSENSAKKEVLDSNIIYECYLAVDGKDSAYLNLKIDERGKVNGDLQIKYAEKPQNNGTITGNYKNDTLFVDYTFKVGELKDVYKNPLAFLKQDNKLKLGIGIIETTLGRSYFVKGEPINFERGKFIFESTPCKNN